MIATPRLVDAFVEMADTLTDDFDLVEFLHRLTEHTASVIPRSSVGLLLADEQGRLHHLVSSSHGAGHLELLELQSSEGPCLDCFRTRRPVTVPDLADVAGRWPQFVPDAAALGLRSVHAFPMRLREQAIGALNVFGDAPLRLGTDDVAVVQALADVATIAIIQERAISAAGILTAQLEIALHSRVVIEQAKGVVAQSTAVGVDEAFTRLRAHARNNHLRLTDLAHDIVTRAIDPAALGTAE